MDTKNDDESVSALAAQPDKADIIMDDPNNIDTQGSTVPIHNNSSSSSSTLLYSIHDKKKASATTPPLTTSDEEEEDGIEFTLPPEITIAVFGLLSIQDLLVCQRVSRHFRVFARTVMLDRLGGQAMGCQRQQCPQCRRNQQQPLWQRSSGGSSTSGEETSGQHGSSALPPLPYHHLINNRNTLLPTTVSPVSHHNSYLQLQDPPQHQLHHHLYQHQSTEDMSQHHQTNLHTHHQSHSYHVQPSRPVSSSQQSGPSAHNHHFHTPSSASQYHHTASYVAPGNIALFLFPYHDYTPTSWQDRQSVHFVCTGIDRLKEQLIFSPIYPEVGDCLKFNTNSWNLPSTFAASGSFGDGFATSFSIPSVLPGGGQDARTLNNNININDPRSTNRFATTGSTTAGSETTYSTGLDLFDYATGRPRFPGSGKANTDSLNSTSYSFANQFNRPHSRSPSLASISSSSSSSSFSSTPPSPPRQSPSPSIITATLPTPSWANITGHGGEHYSVIGIKHGDWPEDQQAAGRWWGGGLHSSMTQESMVYLPWVGASRAFDFHQDSFSSHFSNVRTLNNSNSTQDANMENVSPTSYNNGRNANGECTKIHKHHMCLSSTRPHNPPGHHHRFLCLHHDQLMTDIAAASSSSSSSDSKSNSTNAGSTKTPLTTAGSTHLEVDYGARVTESKRCLFCLSTPCKANLEIQVKFGQLRVSLDWILSGFGPDQKMAASSAPRSNGGSAIADALAMGSVRQGQVPS